MRTVLLLGIFASLSASIAYATGEGCSNTLTFSPIMGVTHQVAVLTDPTGQQTALFDLSWGGILISLKYNGVEYLASSTTTAGVQPLLHATNYTPTLGGDLDSNNVPRGSTMLGVACAAEEIWLTAGMTDYNHNAGAGTSYIYNYNGWQFTMYAAPYTVSTYAYFVPNPNGTPAYYLKLDQTITNIDPIEAVSFTADLSGTATTAYPAAKTYPASCTGAQSSCTPGTTSTLIGGFYTTADATTGVALATMPSVNQQWSSGIVSVTTVTSASGNAIHLQDTGWQVAPLSARSHTTLVMVGTWANALTYAQQGCTFAVSPAIDCRPGQTCNNIVDAGGRSGTLTVTTNGGCQWEGAGDQTWLTASGGSGTGTSTYTVAANPTTAIRTGNLYIAGQVYAIFQRAAALAAPGSLVATAQQDLSVHVTWQSAAGASTYELQRSNGAGFAVVLSNATSPFTDSTASPGVAYLYKVRAIAGANASQFSNVDLATTILFSDDPIAPGVTAAKAAHVSQLRQAVDAVRATAGLAAGTYTDATLTVGVTRIKAIHIQELRTQLNAALMALGLSVTTYTDATIQTGVTVMKAVHIQELRTAMQ